MIHALGKRAGVAINPATPVCMIKEMLPLVDQVLVMTINPGVPGQKFINSTLHKMKEDVYKRQVWQTVFCKKMYLINTK